VSGTAEPAPATAAEPPDRSTADAVDLEGARLVAAARRGDEAAFEALYRRHVGQVLGLARRLAGADAEELVQETFARAWEHRREMRSPVHLKRWLRRVAVNLWINELRRRRFGDRRPDRAEPEAADAVAPTPARPAGLRLDLERALAALTPRLRAVVVLFDLYGLRHDEIADAMEMTPGASKVQLHRARTRLREILQ